MDALNAYQTPIIDVHQRMLLQCKECSKRGMDETIAVSHQLLSPIWRLNHPLQLLINLLDVLSLAWVLEVGQLNSFLGTQGYYLAILFSK